jgi:DNA invertase Pin-like site-specific DNA recombinase
MSSKLTSESKLKAIGYLRVSTDKQAESGLGLEAQREQITACAARLNLPAVTFFTDAGTSGSLGIEDRPALLEAVTALKRGECLLVAKRDRLGRDVVAVAMIERLVSKRGARIVSAAGEGTETNSDDPAGILMRRLIDSFAEYERLIIGSRTRAALAAKRRRGERISRHAPYGFQFAGGRVIPEASEQTTLRQIRSQRVAGFSLQRIADELNSSGCRTRNGAMWRFQYVQSALRRAA